MFDLSKVKSVYSGRKGCACGCLGKYSYASEHKALRPSYYTGDAGVSDRSVKIIANRVEKLLRDGGSVKHVMVAENHEWIAVDLHHDKTYTLYFV